MQERRGATCRRRVACNLQVSRRGGGCRCAVMPVQVQALAGEAGGGGPACQTECSNTRVPARVWPA